MATWEARARRASVARQQSRVDLIDSLPELLTRIADNAEVSSLEGGAPAPVSISRRHANERLEQGYCLADVVEEYSQLRASIFEHVASSDVKLTPRELAAVNVAIDAALRETAQRYVETHHRMLRALDRISGQPTAKRTVDEVLNDILAALKDATAAEVDSIAILLIGEDKRLHARATIGLEDELRSRFSVALGEGFTGTVAQRGKPLLLRDAAHDPIVVSPVLRARGTKGLYGVPLVDEGRVIGVAHIGSCAASEFSDEDMMLFRAMANRATGVIVRAQLVESLERTARFREEFIAVLGHDLRSPLNAVLGTAQAMLIHEADMSDGSRAAWQRVARSSTRMAHLISDLLDLTRTRLGGGFTLNPSHFVLNDVVNEVVDEAAPVAGHRKILVDGDVSVAGCWDRARVAQALTQVSPFS